MNAYAIARESIKRHEGFRLEMYKDTVGKWTIGVGHNIEDRGISNAVADLLLAEDMQAAEQDARILCADSFDSLSVNRQAVIIELAFQLGYTRFSRFVKFADAVRAGNHGDAADELLNSKWAEQVPARAQEMIGVYRLG